MTLICHPLHPATVPLVSTTVPLHPAMVPLKKTGAVFFPDSCRSKAVLQCDSSSVAPIPSAKIDRSTILVIKNGTRCCHNGCPTGYNGWPVSKPLQLSKLMNPLHFQQWPLNQQRPATGATSAFNGYPLKTRSVAVPLSLGDFWRMEHLCVVQRPRTH